MTNQGSDTPTSTDPSGVTNPPAVAAVNTTSTNSEAAVPRLQEEVEKAGDAAQEVAENEQMKQQVIQVPGGVKEEQGENPAEKIMEKEGAQASKILTLLILKLFNITSTIICK